MKKKFGKQSCQVNIFNYADVIAELTSKMVDTNGWHSCDFLFYKKDDKLYYFEGFRIRKASKKILKSLLKNSFGGKFCQKNQKEIYNV